MSKFISLSLAAFAAVTAFASGDTPVEWYTPSDYTTTGQIGYYSLYNLTTKTYDKVEINIGSDGSISEDELIKIVEDNDYDVSSTALRAIASALKAQAQVETLADTLYALLVTDGITIKGKDANGNEISYKIGFKKNADGQISKDGGNIEAETDATYANLPDNATIQWTPSGKAHLQLYGKPTNAADGEGKFPMFNGSTLTWAALKPYFDTKCFTVETVSNAKIKDGGIHLHAWKDETGKDIKLADQMTADTEDTTTRVLVKNGGTNGTLQYWSLGKLDKGGSAKVDGASIVTNETKDGTASIAGFHKDAANGSVPFANGDTLNWTAMPSAGAILGADGNATPRWTSTQSGNYYYGTPKQGGDLGWHELPNVTTNAVEADDATLKSNADEHDQSIKRLSLYNAPGGDGRLYGAFMAGGKLGWAAVAQSTNAQYGVDAVSIDTNGVGGVLQIAGFKDMDGGYLVKSGGKVKSQFFIATNGISRTETAGELNLSSTIGLENWDTPSGTCAENLGGILTGQIQEADGDHFVLTRHKDGKLHYTKIGRVPVAPADGVTITTNNAGAASNKLAIAGAYKSENEGKVLSSTGSGTAWIKADGGQALAFYANSGEHEQVPVVVGSGAVTNAVAFESATDSNVQIECDDDGNGGVVITIGVYYK